MMQLVLFVCFIFFLSVPMSLAFVLPSNNQVSSPSSRTVLSMAIRSQRFRPVNRRRLRKPIEERKPLLTFEQKKEFFEKLEEWAEHQEVYDLWSEEEVRPLIEKYEKELKEKGVSGSSLPPPPPSSSV